jgi:hypothetical protein
MLLAAFINELTHMLCETIGCKGLIARCTIKFPPRTTLGAVR